MIKDSVTERYTVLQSLTLYAGIHLKEIHIQYINLQKNSYVYVVMDFVLCNYN